MGDTLPNPNLQITQLELLINTRPSPTATGSANDRIYLGNKAADTFAQTDPNSGGITTPNGGTAHLIYGTETVYDINSGAAAGTLLTVMNTNHSDLDILVGDQTEVDVARLNLCVIKQEDTGDIGISKNILEQERKGEILTVLYQLSFTGSLSAGQSLTVEDVVPANATFSAIYPNGWACTPQAPLAAGTTLSCTLTGPADPIPEIGIKLISKGEETVKNCARITKGSGTSYNTDPENDQSCVDTNLTDTPAPEGSCEQFVNLDLRPASAWTDENGNHPTENNVFSTYPPHPAWANVIWDGAMNWFDFGSAGNTVHKLNIDFCACGDTQITINELKSDNFSKIYLDTDPTPNSYTNPAYIASRSDGISQSTMASWGPSESGSLTVPFGGTAPTDHVLYFDVKNGFGPSGGAVNGSLSFKGHLGSCQPGDNTGGSDSNGSGVTPTPDHNWTVTVGGTLSVINHIGYLPDPDAPVQPGGTVVIGIEGNISSLTPEGKPIIDNDPEILVDPADLIELNISDGALVAINHLIDPPHYTRDDATQIVTDHQQNLQWQDDENASIVVKQWVTQANYDAGNYMDTSGDTATTYCQNLAMGGITDWRLPTKNELLGIMDYSTSNPSIDTTVFQNVLINYYWSSTTSSNAPFLAWGVGTDLGGSDDDGKALFISVRCVRDLP